MGVITLPIQQSETVALVDLVVGIVDDLPIHQIFRLHDTTSWREVHRGRDHIIGIVDTDDVEIGHIGEDDWIRQFSRLTCWPYIGRFQSAPVDDDALEHLAWFYGFETDGVRRP